MEVNDSSWSVNIAGITVHASYSGLALINNHLAFRRRQAGENPGREVFTAYLILRPLKYSHRR